MKKPKTERFVEALDSTRVRGRHPVRVFRRDERAGARAVLETVALCRQSGLSSEEIAWLFDLDPSLLVGVAM